jgi:hypothetical protein
MEAWDGDKKKYTELFLKGDRSITEQLADALKMNVWHEYYLLDAVFYYDNDLVPSHPSGKTWGAINGIWLTKIRIALEHENQISGSKGVYQEISHLLLTKADFKVVITYPQYNEYNFYLDDFRTIIRNNQDDDSDVLFVFLRINESGDLQSNGYVVNAKEWSDISNV